MRILLLAGFGLALITLTLVLPVIHLASWSGAGPTPLVTTLMAVPPVALVIAVALRSRFATLWLFPISLLPPLVLDPRLTGPLVYSGAGGLLALGGIAALSVAWTLTALSEDPVLRWRHRGSAAAPWLPWLAALVPAAVLVAFAVPALEAGSGLPSQIAVLVGLATAGWATHQWIAGDLAEVRLDPRARDRFIGELLAEQRVRPRSVLSSLAWAVGGIALAVLLHL